MAERRDRCPGSVTFCQHLEAVGHAGEARGAIVPEAAPESRIDHRACLQQQRGAGEEVRVHDREAVGIIEAQRGDRPVIRPDLEVIRDGLRVREDVAERKLDELGRSGRSGCGQEQRQIGMKIAPRRLSPCNRVGVAGADDRVRQVACRQRLHRGAILPVEQVDRVSVENTAEVSGDRFNVVLCLKEEQPPALAQFGRKGIRAPHQILEGDGRALRRHQCWPGGIFQETRAQLYELRRSGGAMKRRRPHRCFHDVDAGDRRPDATLPSARTGPPGSAVLPGGGAIRRCASKQVTSGRLRAATAREVPRSHGFA